MAAVDRGKAVLVNKDVSLSVADHDFTKLKLTPSVTLVCDVPATISETFYHGQVFVTVKDAVLQPSTPLRRATELQRVLTLTAVNPVLKPILLLYADGGPDHRITYVSVQVSLITIFRYLNLDYLVAARTAPMQSFRNPVKRCMALLNLGLQGVGIMRECLPRDDWERRLASCNSMSDIRTLFAEKPQLHGPITDSLSGAFQVICGVLERLKLSDKTVRTVPAATDEEMMELWSVLKAVDASLLPEDTTRKAVESKKDLRAYLDLCCVRCHYFFAIEKEVWRRNLQDLWPSYLISRSLSTTSSLSRSRSVAIQQGALQVIC